MTTSGPMRPEVVAVNQQTLFEYHPCAFYGCGGEMYEIGKYESVADARAAAEGRTDAVSSGGLCLASMLEQCMATQATRTARPGVSSSGGTTIWSDRDR
ncbi:hypothetical protein ACWEOI_21970 [Nocardia sp. NPDC004340]